MIDVLLVVMFSGLSWCCVLLILSGPGNMFSPFGKFLVCSSHPLPNCSAAACRIRRFTGSAEFLVVRGPARQSDGSLTPPWTKMFQSRFLSVVPILPGKFVPSLLKCPMGYRITSGEWGWRKSRNMGSFHTSMNNLVQPNSDKISR